MLRAKNDNKSILKINRNDRFHFIFRLCKRLFSIFIIILIAIGLHIFPFHSISIPYLSLYLNFLKEKKIVTLLRKLSVVMAPLIS